MYNKIYIIGPPGSGKTTFAAKLSKKCNIKYYELDKVSWDEEHGNVRREADETQKLFKDILKNKKWIIEDVGRDIFKQGREEADIIYYINFSKLRSYFRVTTRWIKQKLGKEEYNCPPAFREWLYYIPTINKYYKEEKLKLKSLEKYKNKLKFIGSKDIKQIIEDLNQ